MRIKDEQIEEFKKIYKEEYGEEINDIDARESAQNLVGLFELSAKNKYGNLA